MDEERKERALSPQARRMREILGEGDITDIHPDFDELVNIEDVKLGIIGVSSDSKDD